MYLKTCFIHLFLLFGVLPSAWGQRSLTERLDSLINAKLPKGSDVGVSVYDLTGKAELYSYRADKLSRPASNMKLLTAITALARLNYNEPFRTEVWYKGTVKQDTLAGDLYVVGGFDPEFGNEAMDSLVSRVRAFPFSVIEGNIYGDISMKDSLYWGSGWAWDDTPSSFQPYMTPLMFHKGMVTVTALPGEKGDTAVILCEPESSFYTLVNKTKSKSYDAGKFAVSRNWLEGKDDIIVSGNVQNRNTGEVNVSSSQNFFMHVFTERLRKQGVEIPGTYTYAEFAEDTLSACITHWDTSLQQVVRKVLKDSDNLGAEALLCRLAVHATGKKKVSWEEGLSVVKNQIKRVGHEPDGYRIADGSGLSNYNCISPQLLVDFLKYAYSNTALFQRLYKALPISGIDGTLQYRMRGSKAYKKVHAKTGTVTGISSLAGYLKTSNGHDIAFAIMNQNQMKAKDARTLQDLICEMLCE
ncbi:D-alanyl-D-alanine carboxypeptidase/D-alanyl-D-alanine-endopeptidase [Bacteroides sp. 224]|uniref:D-alanyl-D-alanine carboxypeptidase/D-alanyl-D-alanine endopeptidase n=1 Tax=Bacteroides sp. 224 TaxID=2302936 RepID=UPI001940306B|nr:D-alanyl-D-alanine carboxypeptidase/D-alanyl-D-alanine-endopeptidase [Bacteroides sp. 224]NDV65734.1 D-alanyl-D-alanine carboxypeptidase/D-alanyl-D-alanine-endopeptidase [Bacteroides sp. 224]